MQTEMYKATVQVRSKPSSQERARGCIALTGERKEKKGEKKNRKEKKRKDDTVRRSIYRSLR